jgi:hypothetical protein
MTEARAPVAAASRPSTPNRVPGQPASRPASPTIDRRYSGGSVGSGSVSPIPVCPAQVGPSGPVSLTTQPIRIDRRGATIVDVDLTLPATPVALASGVATRVPVELRNPRSYPVVDVIAHSGADGGRPAAETEHTRPAAAGIPVRLVDSLTSDQLADDDGGFRVLLQDGFGSDAATAAYCWQRRRIAPEYQVVA